MRSKTVTLIFGWILVICHPASAQSSTVIIQPGSDGKDVWITDIYSYGSDYGVDDDKLQAGGWGDQYNSLIQFDISNGPRTAQSAILYLYSFSSPNDGTYTSMYLDRVTQPWNEDVGWYNRPAFVQQATILPAPAPDQWYAIDLTFLYNNWKQGLYPNYGIQLRPTKYCCKNSANFRSSDYSIPYLRPKLVISNVSLAFPLPGKTPYNNLVTSVMDHSVPGGYYTRDSKVTAYNGEFGNRNPYFYASTIVAYQSPLNDSSSMPASFSLPLLNYTDAGISDTNKRYLFYDGHPGYDYAAAWRTSILAASSGTLCISTSETTRIAGRPWRDASRCPYGNDTVVNRSLSSGQSSWDRWHMFYILDSAGVYSTWYLHADALQSGVWQSVLNNGYVPVEKLQEIGYVGNFGLGSNCSGQACKHLHFEVRTSLSTVVDPYRTSAGGVLCEIQP